MTDEHLKILETFTLDSLPNLDVAVLGALERLARDGVPAFDNAMFGAKPLIVGSANAYAVGRILFEDTQAEYAEEGEVERMLETFPDRDSIVIVSASGGKDALSVTKSHKDDLPVWLLTNNPEAPAAAYVAPSHVVLFPKNREPYTYNTSTYLSMILAKTGEDPALIQEHLLKLELPDSLESFSSFVMTVPPQFDEVRAMFRTKFDELFGGYVHGRIFTDGEVKHAKTVVPSEEELSIHFGSAAEGGISIPLPEDAGYGAMVAVGYYVIGRIQAAHPPYFKENIVEYAKQASSSFNQNITPIVE